MLTFSLVEICVNPVQDFPEVDLGRIEEHHHRIRRTDLVGERQRKDTLGQGDPAFRARNTTSREVQLGEDVTRDPSASRSHDKVVRLFTSPAVDRSSRQNRRDPSLGHLASSHTVS